MNENFQNIHLERGNFRVAWEYIGEGLSGDYNENDPNDSPMLRFYCEEYKDGDWYELPSGSYCTQHTTEESLDVLLVKAGRILEIISKDDWSRRELEMLTWNEG